MTITKEKDELEKSLTKQQEKVSSLEKKQKSLEKENASLAQEVEAAKTVNKEKEKLEKKLKEQQEIVANVEKQLETVKQEKNDSIPDVETETKASKEAEKETVTGEKKKEKENKEKIKNENILDGNKLVVLGSLESMNRDTAKSLVQQAGGTLTSSPSSRTNYVIIGKKPGDKLKKSQKLGIPQLSETQFLEALKTAGITEISN